MYQTSPQNIKMGQEEFIARQAIASYLMMSLSGAGKIGTHRGM